MRRLVLGTRASALALAQTELTRSALLQGWPEIEVDARSFTTRGDRKLDLDLKSEPAGGKGLFTKELEDALLSGEIDVAVHSLKDLPGNNPPGLSIVGVLPRASIADVLISKTAGDLAGLATGSVIGTSSIRRARQLQWVRPDLRIIDWRGNVQTRLRRLGEHPDCTAIVLAQAGLERLGFDISAGVISADGLEFRVSTLLDHLLPAIGQGVIALQSLSSRQDVATILGAISHEPTALAVRAERELQRLLGGDCTLPVGVHTVVEGKRMTMEGILFLTAKADPIEARVEGPVEAPERVGAELAALLRKLD